MTVLKKDHTGLVNRLMYSLVVLQIPLSIYHTHAFSRSPAKKSNEIEAPNIATVRGIMCIRPNMQ